MRNSIFIPLLIILLLNIGYAQAQVSGSNSLYYHISAKDGLTDNVASCFYQDSRGVMWIGTTAGLNSFDGSEIYTWVGGPGKLSDSRVYAITEDKRRNLWIATFNGLNRFNLVTRKIESYIFPAVDNHMQCVAIRGDSIWMGTDDGLLLFNVKLKTYQHFTNTAVKPTNMMYYFDNHVIGMLLDSKNRMWVGTENGLWFFDLKKHSYQLVKEAPGEVADGMANSIYEDKAGRLWEGCWNTGLKQIIPEQLITKNLLKIPGMPTHVISIAEGTDDTKKPCIWLSGQLTKFSQQDQKIERYELKPVAQAASLDANCVYVSRDNLLWISTVKGIYILDPTRQLFKHTFVTAQNTITGQAPGLYDDNGRFWLGGDNKCLLQVYDSNFNMVKNYSPLIKKMGEPYASAAVMSIHPYINHQLILCTSSGLITIDTLNGKIAMLSHGVVDSLQRATSFINGVYIDKDRMWCFPWRRGIWQYSAATKKFVLVKMNLPESGGGPKNMNIAAATADSYGNIWMADLDYGLVKYNKTTHKIQRIIDNTIPAYSRCVNVLYLHNKLWLLTNQSIVQVDPQTNATESWPIPGSISQYIADYTDDGAGNLWIATRAGLVVFNMASHTFDHYTEEDGLLNNNLDGNLHLLKNGTMVYVSENYITSFRPADLLHTPAKKNLLLTRIIANDSDIVVNSNQMLIIPAGTEKLTLKWAFINYTNPLQNHYYNKLDGIDKDWNYAGTKGSIEYNGLEPGDYTFRYRAVTPDGLLFTEKVISFKVLPTFWQSWWFIACLVVSGIGCIMLIINFVRLRERKRSAIQLQLSALEMKALRAQMNPHFIFNALNSIQECIITKNTDTAYSYLSNFSKLVRMILENSEKHFITLEDEIETLRLYLSLEKLRFDDTFEYNINVDPLIDTTFIQIPALVLQPYAENALWHGLIHKKGKKTITITFEQHKGQLKCIIEDNGIGRVMAAQMQTKINKVKKRSMGMAITEERLQLLEKEASIIINDLHNENGEPAGTRVIILIPLEF